MNDTLLLLVVAGAGLGVGLAVWSMARLGARLAGKSARTWDDELAKRLPLPLAVLCAIVTAALALDIAASDLDPRLVSESRRVVSVLFILGAAWAVLHLLRFLLGRATRGRARFQPAARVMSRVLALALYALTFLTILSEYGIAVTPLLTGLGIAALAVALALQDTLANFFAGIWIQTGRSLQPGHFVKLESEKLEGYVEQVGWRVTSLRTLNGNTIVIPNSKIAQAVITDYNLPAPDLSVGMDFRAGFETEPARVIALLIEEAKEVQRTRKGMLDTVEPFAQLSAIGDDALHYNLSFRATEFVQQFSAQNEIRLRVLLRFRKEGIRIPYPTHHSIQEPVDTPAARVPAAPGGFSPADRRPPRPRTVETPPKDPREAEAEKAKGDIAQQQAEKADKAEEAPVAAAAQVSEAAEEPVPPPAP
ncbi:MAG: mechanosensitive ion channel family protein [Thermoplasmatota archaeon]